MDLESLEHLLAVDKGNKCGILGAVEQMSVKEVPDWLRGYELLNISTCSCAQRFLSVFDLTTKYSACL